MTVSRHSIRLKSGSEGSRLFNGYDLYTFWDYIDFGRVRQLLKSIHAFIKMGYISLIVSRSSYTMKYIDVGPIFYVHAFDTDFTFSTGTGVLRHLFCYDLNGLISINRHIFTTDHRKTQIC